MYKNRENKAAFIWEKIEFLFDFANASLSKHTRRDLGCKIMTLITLIPYKNSFHTFKLLINLVVETRPDSHAINDVTFRHLCDCMITSL